MCLIMHLYYLTQVPPPPSEATLPTFTSSSSSYTTIPSQCIKK